VTLLALLLATAPPTVDPVALTRLTMVLDAPTWESIKGSAFLPEGFGAGFLAGPSEIRLCARLTCVVMVPEDTAAGHRVGDVEFGLQPATGSALADRLARLGDTAGVAIVPAPPPPDLARDPGAAPIMYYLESATIAVTEATLLRVDPLLRSAGATVVREGAGLVVQFPNQTLRLVPDYGGGGAEQLTWYLRREAPGNPTYRFGGLSRLRFGPGRTATWTF
jgi:hypothetical protein